MEATPLQAGKVTVPVAKAAPATMIQLVPLLLVLIFLYPGARRLTRTSGEHV